jgi:hypothetical protein
MSIVLILYNSFFVPKLKNVEQLYVEYCYTGFHQNGTINMDIADRNLFFTMAQQPLVGRGLLIIEDSRSHSDTPQSVGLLWTSDQPVTETSLPDNTQHSQETDIHAPGVVRTRNPSKRVIAHRRPRTRGHWYRNYLHRHMSMVFIASNFLNFSRQLQIWANMQNLRAKENS